jgi:hypothetical protein
MRSRNLLQNVADRLLRLLRASILSIYNNLFSGLDKRSNERRGRKLLRDVESSFSELIRMRKGRVLLDYGTVVVQFTEIKFQIIRWHGELRVRVAAPNDPEGWRGMNAFLLGVNSQARSVPAEVFDTADTPDALDTIAKALETYWEPILATIHRA